MFYDEVQDVASKDIHEKAHKIVSIFLKTGDKDKLQEQWVNTLSDGFNLMRIDAFKKENADIVKSFNVKSTPYVIIFDDKKTQLETVIDDTTFDKVKDLLLKAVAKKNERPTFSNDKVPPPADKIPAEPKAEAKPAEPKTQAKPAASKIPVFPKYQPPKSTTPAKPKTEEKPKSEEKPKAEDKSKKSEEEKAFDDALQQLKEAQKANENAQNEVKKANDALSKAKKQMVEYAHVEDAQKKAKSSQEATDKALKSYQEAKKKLEDKIKAIKKGVDEFDNSNRPPAPVPSQVPVVKQMINPGSYYPYQGQYRQPPRRDY